VKILCVSDQIDPLVYSNSIKERFSHIDLVLCAGDLPLDYLDFIISSLNKPLLFVFGNHHIEDMHYFFPFVNNPLTESAVNRYSGGIHINAKMVTEQGLIIAGFGGSMRYNRGPNQFSNFMMYIKILKLIPSLLINKIFRGRYIDILLTHAPPEGIHDRPDICHRGFKAFRWFINAFKPKYLVHGHIHLYDLSDVRITHCKNTLVVNAYSHYIIDTEIQ